MADSTLFAGKVKELAGILIQRYPEEIVLLWEMEASPNFFRKVS